ncbi:hypothetical protein [Pseudarthrobacter sp. S6]|uniref:hypothetical protein n=1 Tax=Pseudarthrobacter sp. S6 TaxID=3418420 RepID=UPI003CEEF064
MSYILVDTPNPYTAQGVFPRRGGANLSGTCIVHTSEGNWAAGVDSLTRLVQTRSDYGCYHRACDWQDIALYYPWEWEAWQDSETNNWAVGIAAACRTSDWAIMPADVREGYYRNMARMAADFVTYMASKGVAVPLRRLSGAEARARVPGFAAHGDSGVARSDPGADFNWALFFNYTAQALGGLQFSSESITPLEDDMPWNDAFDKDVRGSLQNITNEVRGLSDLNIDLRGDLANKGRQLAALTAATNQLATLLAEKQGLDVEAVRAAVSSAIAAGLTITVEAGK